MGKKRTKRKKNVKIIKDHDKPEIEKGDHAIEDLVSSFTDSIDSLLSTLRPALFAAISQYKRDTEDLKSFSKKYGIGFKSTTDSFRAKFSDTNVGQAYRLYKKSKKSLLSTELIPRSFMVALVSEYDAFLGRLLCVIFQNKIDILSSSEKTVKLCELMEFENIEEVRDSLIEKDVESVIRKSHSDQFSWMEKRFNIKLIEKNPLWATFIELTERRNLIVHCDGVISQQYIKVCKENAVNLSRDQIVGKKLSVSEEYFSRAHSCVYTIAVKLSQVLWRKLFKDSLEQADSALLRCSYDLLINKKYDIARDLLDFSCEKFINHSSENYRRMFIINRAQAYKWSKNNNKAIEIVNAEDWTATGKKFSICVNVLLDNFEKACEVMKEIGSNGDISEADYSDWPLFKEFRSSKFFLDAFKDVFSKDFLDLEKELKEEKSKEISQFFEKLSKIFDEEE